MHDFLQYLSQYTYIFLLFIDEWYVAHILLNMPIQWCTKLHFPFISKEIYNLQASFDRRADAWGPFLTSPLAPRGKICPLGEMFTTSFAPRWTLYCLEEWRGEQRISSPTENFTPPGDKIHPGGQLRPWGQSLHQGAK
jgi:hypothetical protein